MSLNYEMIRYTELTGEDGTKVPISRLGGYLDGYEKGIANALDDFQKWLSTQIVGVDDKTKEILVVKEDRWELAIDAYKEII